MKFLRRRRAADDGAPLDHRDLQSRRREIGGRDQAVVAAADDDDDVAHSFARRVRHRKSLLRASGAWSNSSFPFCAASWRQVGNGGPVAVTTVTSEHRSARLPALGDIGADRDLDPRPLPDMGEGRANSLLCRETQGISALRQKAALKDQGFSRALREIPCAIGAGKMQGIFARVQGIPSARPAAKSGRCGPGQSALMSAPKRSA